MNLLTWNERIAYARMNALRVGCDHNGYTQEELADLIGVSKVTLSKWENQKVKAFPTQYKEILCGTLQIRPEWLEYGILPMRDRLSVRDFEIAVSKLYVLLADSKIDVLQDDDLSWIAFRKLLGNFDSDTVDDMYQLLHGLLAAKSHGENGKNSILLAKSALSFGDEIERADSISMLHMK